MTELKQLFDGLAEQARVYDVVERAKHRGRRRRYRRRAAVAGGAMLSVASVLIGLSVIPQAAPVLAPSPSATIEETPTPRPEQVIACQADELALPSGYPRKVFVTGGDPTGRYVLGRLYPDGARDRLAIWDGGQPRTVAMQGADDTFHDITTTGVAVGSSFIGEDEASWIFQNGKLTRLPGTNVKAVAINENLVIAGLIGSMPASWRTPASAPEPLPLPPGEWLLGDVRGIDDRGYIVGSMITKEGNKGGATKGLLWHPDGTVEILPNPAEYPDPESVWPTGIRGD